MQNPNEPTSETVQSGEPLFDATATQLSFSVGDGQSALVARDVAGTTDHADGSFANGETETDAQPDPTSTTLDMGATLSADDLELVNRALNGDHDPDKIRELQFRLGVFQTGIVSTETIEALKAIDPS